MKGAITSSVWRIQRVLLGAILWIGICSGTMGEDLAEVTQKAAEQGDAEAQYNFGVMYYNGQSVRKNDAEAVKWFRKAAEQGHAEAMNFLAYLYINNFSLGIVLTHTGVAKDTAEAMKWYRKAAEQGHAEAMFNLAVTYDNGEEGVPEDDAEAVKWYRKAAEQGHAPAANALGQMYKYGWGVPKDDVAAYAWYSVGAALRAHYRKNRDSFKRSLTPAQVEKGEALAKEISERIQKRKEAEKAN